MKCYYCDRQDVVYDCDATPLCPDHEDEGRWDEDYEPSPCIFHGEDSDCDCGKYSEEYEDAPPYCQYCGNYHTFLECWYEEYTSSTYEDMNDRSYDLPF